MPGKLDLPSKVCKTCGTVFNRKVFSGRLEDATVYSKREHCSRTCGNSRENIKPKSYLWRSRKHRKANCEACGDSKRLAVHHCDQDQTNNDPSNLQTLCKSCHDFWHATAKRLGRPVAGRMPSLGLPMKEPIGHTDLKPLGMDRFREYVQQHGECLTYGEAANV